jgi:hypothetical protein
MGWRRIYFSKIILTLFLVDIILLRFGRVVKTRGDNILYELDAQIFLKSARKFKKCTYRKTIVSRVFNAGNCLLGGV